MLKRADLKQIHAYRNQLNNGFHRDVMDQLLLDRRDIEINLREIKARITNLLKLMKGGDHA